MKKVYFLFLLVFTITSCQDFAEEITVTTENDIAETRAAGSNGQDYYWYQGKKIYLTRNEKYVNIVSESGKLVKSSTSEAAANALTRSGDTQYKLLPFFERGEGVEPIGTSDIFYLKLKKPEDIVLLEKMAAKLGVQVIEEIPHTPCWYTLSILGSEFVSSIEASNFFYETGQFEDVDPAFMFDFKPNADDPEFWRQWGMNNASYPDYDINVVPAWEITRGAGIKVAVVDTPIDSNHGDLDGNIHALSYNAQLKQTSSAAYSGDSHGTHVSGIIAAEKNGSQVTGVAYESKIVRVSHNIIFTSTISSELAAGINWAWKSPAQGGAGVDVINCSWGDRDQYHNVHMEMHSIILEQAIIDAMTKGRGGKGCVVVFAAGNSGHLGAVVNYPANFHNNILVVGAIESDGSRRSTSGYGTQLDVVAPGSSIWSTIGGGSTGYMSGTSMAAPHVSGVAALMLSRFPHLTAAEVENRIKNSATPLAGGANYVGAGLVNAREAIRGTYWEEYYEALAVTPAIDYVLVNESSCTLGNVSIFLNGNVGGTPTSLIDMNPGEVPAGETIQGYHEYPGFTLTAPPGTPITNLELELYTSSSPANKRLMIGATIDYSDKYSARYVTHQFQGYETSLFYSLSNTTVPSASRRTMYIFVRDY